MSANKWFCATALAKHETMNCVIKQLALAATIVVAGTFATGPFSAKPANAGCSLGPSNAPYGNGMDVYCDPSPGPAAPSTHYTALYYDDATSVFGTSWGYDTE